MNSILERLYQLQGTWVGKGSGKFPTIDSFNYQEELTFEVNREYPLIHYEQKTVIIATQKPSHWESGFIRVIDDKIIEISNVQNSGRVEVLHGNMAQQIDVGFEIQLDSIVLANDPRMISTKRTFKLKETTLECTQSMATNTTEEAVMLPHLYSMLTKIDLR